MRAHTSFMAPWGTHSSPDLPPTSANGRSASAGAGGGSRGRHDKAGISGCNRDCHTVMPVVMAGTAAAAALAAGLKAPGIVTARVRPLLQCSRCN